MDKDQQNRRRWWLRVVIGALVVLLIAHAVLFQVLLPMRGYAVSKDIQVRVLVADVDTRQPLSNVPVVVFRSCEVCYEDAPRLPHGVQPDDFQKEYMTGEAGTVEISWPFHASIGKGALGTSGSVLSNTWVQISPPGYSTVVLPLDGQSTRRRDYHDENLIVLTVLLSKPKGN